MEVCCVLDSMFFLTIGCGERERLKKLLALSLIFLGTRSNDSRERSFDRGGMIVRELKLIISSNHVKVSYRLTMALTGFRARVI